MISLFFKFIFSAQCRFYAFLRRPKPARFVMGAKNKFTINIIRMSVVFDKKVLDCFSTLGIEPTNNMCLIQRAYRDTVRMVHPDKVRHLGVGWTKEECRAAFDNIRESYIYLKGQFNEIDLPDYDIVYLDEEFNTELKNTEQHFDLQEFNNQFTAKHKYDGDDYAFLGYSEFRTSRVDGRATLNAENIEEALEIMKKSRDIPIVAEWTKPVARKTGQIMKYLPDAQLSSPTIQHSIIGETVNDFTMGNLTDIRMAYENDYETWEDTYRGVSTQSVAQSVAQCVEGRPYETEGMLIAAIESRLKIEPLGEHELEQVKEKKRIEDDIERTRRRRANLRNLREA